MINLKSLKDGDNLYFVCDNENAVYCGKVLKKSHKAVEFVSDCGNIKFRVRGNENFLFYSMKEASNYFYSNKSNVKKSGPKKETKDAHLNDNVVKDVPDIEVFLEKKDTLDDIWKFLYNLKLNKHGQVVSIVFVDGDAVFFPVLPNGMIGNSCDTCLEARGFIDGVKFIANVNLYSTINLL